MGPHGTPEIGDGASWRPGLTGAGGACNLLLQAGTPGAPASSSAGEGLLGGCSRVFTLVRGVRPRYTCSITHMSCQNTRAASHSVTIIEIRGHILIFPFAKGAIGFMIY